MTLVDIDRIIDICKKWKYGKDEENIHFYFKFEQVIQMLEIAKEKLSANQKENNMKFEKVSFEQYKNSVGGDYDITAEYNDIKLPKRATTGSAGYDFFAPFSFTLEAGETIKFPTGIRALLDSDKFLAIYPRSGLGFKYRVQLDNTVGIIDSDYSQSDNEGHIFIKITNDSRDGKRVEIKKGDAVAQGIIHQFFTTEDDNTDGVRNGGFGSTTKSSEK